MATVGPAGAASLLAMQGRIVENGAGTYTLDFKLPAGSSLVDIIVEAEALWAAGTSAALIVGDATDDDGFIVSTDLKATDLLAGETIHIDGGVEGAGGKLGAYATVGTTTHVTQRYSASERTITAKVTSVGAGTTGRTRVTVIYARGGITEVTQ
jgi:hypothetical protein